MIDPDNIRGNDMELDDDDEPRWVTRVCWCVTLVLFAAIGAMLAY